MADSFIRIGGSRVASDLQTDGNGTEVNVLKTTGGGGGATTATVTGNSASGATDSGNPVKVGGVYRTTPPTLTDGQRGDLQVGPNGNLITAIGSGTTALTAGIADGASDTVTAAGNGLIVRSYGLVYDTASSNWRRARGDTNGTYGVATGSAASAVGMTPVVGRSATSLVVKASAGNFYGATIRSGATAGILVAYNAAAAPAAGAALTAGLILGVVDVAANATASIGEFVVPDRFSSGVVLLFTTTLATFTAPANPAEFLRGRAM